MIGVDDRVGSLDTGKDGDIVIWNTDPLSTYARVEKVFIDGQLIAADGGFSSTHPYGRVNV